MAFTANPRDVANPKGMPNLRKHVPLVLHTMYNIDCAVHTKLLPHGQQILVEKSSGPLLLHKFAVGI